MKDFKDTVHLLGERQTENRERSVTESTPVIRITIRKKKKVFKWIKV